MLDLDRLAATPATPAPFTHIEADGLLPQDQREALSRDFPDPKKTGFFPVEELTYGPAFARLLEDLRAPEFSRIVGEKLGKDLGQRPKMIVVRKWSALKDGRPHTDGLDKVATALVYLNDDWKPEEGGALRYLETQDLDGPGSEPIPASYGAFTAFACERRVVQLFWLVDEAAAARKDKRHKRTGVLKALWPF